MYAKENIIPVGCFSQISIINGPRTCSYCAVTTGSICISRKYCGVHTTKLLITWYYNTVTNLNHLLNDLKYKNKRVLRRVTK